MIFQKVLNWKSSFETKTQILKHALVSTKQSGVVPLKQEAWWRKVFWNYWWQVAPGVYTYSENYTVYDILSNSWSPSLGWLKMDYSYSAQIVSLGKRVFIIPATVSVVQVSEFFYNNLTIEQLPIAIKESRTLAAAISVPARLFKNCSGVS